MLTIHTAAQQIVKSTKRSVGMLFVRGDGVVLLAPPVRTGAR
jgi:U6 snRNA-associated Sm-like protein LSm3